METPARRSRPRLRLAREIAIRALLLFTALYAGSRIVAPSSIPIKSGELSLRVVPRLPGGRLIVPLGPLGQISWRVDRAPVDIEANLLLDPNAGTLPAASDIDVGRFRRELLRTKLLWILLFGVSAAMLAVHGTSVRPIHAAAGGAAVMVGVTSFLTALAVLTFNAKAFDDPRYRGPFRDVPRIVALIKEIRADFPGTKRNIADAVAGLAKLRRDLLAGAPRTDEPTTKMLVVSDLHNNPLGMIIAQRLVSEFKVDAILDAGDVTDRGTALEGDLFGRFASIEIPHVIAAGNHEDSAALERIGAVPHVTLLAGDAFSATVAGITIAGGEDPNARSVDIDPENDRAKLLIPQRCQAIRQLASSAHAGVVLVHDPRLGECAAAEAEKLGRPLLFVWGHLHKPAFAERGSVVSVSPGTSGAAGFKTGRDRPYGFALLEFDSVTHEPVSVCLFAFDHPSELGNASCHVLQREAAAA